MLTVYKYKLQTTNYTRLELPMGAKLLHVAAQAVPGGDDAICLWALVDPTAKTESKIFRVAGTGHPIENEERWRFIGTVFLFGGDLVFHIFELDPKHEPPAEEEDE